jgi:phasin family protein
MSIISPDQLAAAGKRNIDSVYSLLQTQLFAIEKLSALSFDYARSSLDASVLNAKALLDARGVQDVINLSSAAAQPAIDRFISYSRGVYGITTEAQSQVGEVIKAQAAEFNTQAEGAIDSLENSGLPGSQTTAAALKTALSASQTAYDSLAKAGKQTSDFVQASIDAVTPKAPV